MNIFRFFFSIVIIVFGLHIPAYAMEKEAAAAIPGAGAIGEEQLVAALNLALATETLSEIENAVEEKRDYDQVIAWTTAVLFEQENANLVGPELHNEFCREVSRLKGSISIESLWRFIIFAIENNKWDEAIFWYQFGLREEKYLPLVPGAEDFVIRFISEATFAQLTHIIIFFPDTHSLHDGINRRIKEILDQTQLRSLHGERDAVDDEAFVQIQAASNARDIEGLIRLSNQFPVYGNIINDALTSLMSAQDSEFNADQDSEARELPAAGAGAASQSFVSSISDHPRIASATLVVGAAASVLMFWLSRRK
jgi:hypothetical protein